MCRLYIYIDRERERERKRERELKSYKDTMCRVYIYIYIYNTLSGGKGCFVAPGVTVPPCATETVLSPLDGGWWGHGIARALTRCMIKKKRKNIYIYIFYTWYLWMISVLLKVFECWCTHLFCFVKYPEREMTARPLFFCRYWCLRNISKFINRLEYVDSFINATIQIQKNYNCSCLFYYIKINSCLKWKSVELYIYIYRQREREGVR